MEHLLTLVTIYPVTIYLQSKQKVFIKKVSIERVAKLRCCHIHYEIIVCKYFPLLIMYF